MSLSLLWQHIVLRRQPQSFYISLEPVQRDFLKKKLGPSVCNANKNVYFSIIYSKLIRTSSKTAWRPLQLPEATTSKILDRIF